MKKLIKNIQKWGRDREINNPTRQLKKMSEETLEAQEALVDFDYTQDPNDWYHLTEEVGDMGVVWILLCQALGIDPYDALEAAHKKNKDRTGVTINGDFRKDEK